MHTFKCFRVISVSSVVLALATLAAGAADEWPQFRGPNRDDVSPDTGLLKDWSAGGPPLVWEATGLGPGYSGISLVDNRIFTAGDKGDSSMVIALNAADGKQAWSARLGKSDAPGEPRFEGPRSTPTVSDGLVLALGQWGDLVCYDAASGKEIWRKDLTKDFGGAYPSWGYAESPLVDGDRVVVTPGGSKGAVVALNKKTGELVWQSKEFTDAAHYSSLIIAEIGGTRQYIQLTPDSVAGIGASDGKLLWRVRRKGNVAVIPSPIYADGMVYVSSGYGTGCNLFKLTAANGQFSGEQVYANKIMANHHGGVVRVGDYVYGYSEGKGWTCQDLKTGEAKWQEREKLGKGSLVCADGRLYLRQEDRKGTVALIEPTPDGYKEHGRFDQPDRSSKNSWPHPVVVGGRLYLRDQDILLCYNVKAK
ncbi:MAG TPA: PQQ-binding-like beta-propeller repeat protein [Verrucomicrobiae bacterium]|nr:PQQ-binding-like beta-propeller repeat protein [Verrucomicrobiae bacterium]